MNSLIELLAKIREVSLTMAMIVVDAADFIDEIQDGYAIADDHLLAWLIRQSDTIQSQPHRTPQASSANDDQLRLHNNIGLLMDYPQFKTKDHRVRSYGTREPVAHTIDDVRARCEAPEPGRYHLFVRSHGHEQSGFRVSINGCMDACTFGTSPLSWCRGGVYDLEKGPIEIRLHVVAPVPCLDVIVLTTDEHFDGDALPMEYFPEEAQLLREYDVPDCHTVKFGLLTADQRIGFVTFSRDWSARAYDHDGRELWRYDAPPLTELMKNRGSFEPPGVVWDLDRDGRGEVIHWRYVDGASRLVLADGETGQVKCSTEFPSVSPDACNNYRIAVARLRPGYPQNIIVLTDSGGTISVSAYDDELRLLWRHTEVRKKDNLGHYVYPWDIDGDGLDEVLAGALALSSEGNVLWNRLEDDNNNHIDSMRFADLDGDGIDELIAVYSGLGVYAINAQIGETLWSAPAEHTQQLEVGRFLADVPGVHIAAGARIYSSGKHYLYSQIYWYDSLGRLIGKWPAVPLNGNPDLAKGDWSADGSDTCFWYRFRIEQDGTGKLLFPDQVYHVFDFTGEGADSVITLGKGRLRVYGCRNARRDVCCAKRDIDYMYRKVVNHTHY